MTIKRIVSLWFIILNFLFTSASASPYEISLYKELSYLGIGATMTLTGYINEQNKKESTTAELDSLDTHNIPNFEQQFAGRWNKTMHLSSDLLLLSSLASPALMLHIKKQDYFTIALMYTETIALTGGGMALAKGSVTRYRPFTYGNNAPLEDRRDIDAKRSFFSGHAALSSASLMFTATTFSDYHPSSKYNKYLWSGAIAGSLLVSGLRVAGGKHFPSDVIAGLVWGSFVGYAVPASHRKKTDLTITPFTAGDVNGLILSTYF